MKKLILTLLNFLLVITLSLSSVQAQTIGGPTPNCSPTGKAVATSLGCVPTVPEELASGILDVAIKVGGGIAFIFLLMGAFHLITSGGDPEHVQHAKDQITAAITGLLLIVFSVVILRIAGIDVLGIPGFQRGANSVILP